jgi:hypothetical protein
MGFRTHYPKTCILAFVKSAEAEDHSLTFFPVTSEEGKEPSPKKCPHPPLLPPGRVKDHPSLQGLGDTEESECTGLAKFPLPISIRSHLLSCPPPNPNIKTLRSPYFFGSSFLSPCKTYIK